MITLKRIIELETSGQSDKAYIVALHSPDDAWDLYQEYKNFTDSLDKLLNDILL